MKILAFDTSANACSVALQNGEEISYLHNIAPMQQAKLILPMIQELLAKSSLSLNELDAIAYGCGPGSFTGIRIASSVAQGLAFAAQKPVIPVSSLALLAETAALEHQCTHLLIAVDARMNQLYWASYIAGQNGQITLRGMENLCSASEIEIPEKGEWCGVGDGWDKYPDQIRDRIGFEPQRIYSSQLPDAQALLRLATMKFKHNQWITAAEAVPVYLR